jgi:sugar/nucleoside kinase (ribokinase family)
LVTQLGADFFGEMISAHLSANGVRVDAESVPGAKTSLARTGGRNSSGHRIVPEHIVGLSDIVKVSDEDLRWLHPGRLDEDVAREWQARGPALVVVTRGARGVFAVTRDLSLQQPSKDCTARRVRPSVGTGDRSPPTHLRTNGSAR